MNVQENKICTALDCHNPATQEGLCAACFNVLQKRKSIIEADKAMQMRHVTSDIRVRALLHVGNCTECGVVRVYNRWMTEKHSGGFVCENSRKRHLKFQRKIRRTGWKTLMTKSCEMCGETNSKKLCYDHCHVREKFRATLCKKCNSLLGFSEDSPRRLFSAIKTLLRTMRPDIDKTLPIEEQIDLYMDQYVSPRYIKRLQKEYKEDKNYNQVPLGKDTFLKIDRSDLRAPIDPIDEDEQYSQ